MAYNQSPKSMALKALIGNQKNLPDALKKKILESSPAKQVETKNPAIERGKKIIQKERQDCKEKGGKACEGYEKDPITPAKNYKKGYYGK